MSFTKKLRSYKEIWTTKIVTVLVKVGTIALEIGNYNALLIF